MFSSARLRFGAGSARRSMLVLFGIAALFAAALFAAGCGGSTTDSASDDTEVNASEDTGDASDNAADAREDTGEASDETADASDDAAEASEDTGADASDNGAEAGEETGEAGEDTGSAEGDEAYLEADSPLAAYLGIDYSNPDAMVEQGRAIDQSIQRCMSAQGFQYELMSTTGSEGSIFEDEANMSAAEFAAAHGYGIVDYTREFVSGLDDDASADPNAALVEAMSDSERSAWETALYGATLDEADTEAMPEGCLGDAMSEVFGKLGALMELEPKLEEMIETASADPRVVEIYTKWATCMSEAGYNFEDSGEASEYIAEKVEVVGNEADASAASAEADEQAQLDELNAELDEIRVEEVAIATADAACLGDDAEKLDDIHREYELQFIEDNKAVLDAPSS